MPKAVQGFLASDGTFFDDEAECRRHEASRALILLCETHNVNIHNLFALLHEWHEPIKEYFDADKSCKTKLVVPAGTIAFEEFSDVPPTEEDRADSPGGDEDAQTFQQFEARRHQ